MLDLFLMTTSLLDFAQADSGTESRWRSFKNLNLPSYLNQERPDSLIPFSGTPIFNELSEQEKQKLYVAFTQFNAEVVIMLELILYDGFKKFQTSGCDESVVNAVKKIRLEEKLHTKGFMSFLKKETPAFPKTSFILRNNKWLKHIFLHLVRWNPVSLALSAAKVEAFSVYYGKCLRSSYKENNLWVEVNYLHLLDESHHVGFEFDLFCYMTEKSNKLEKLKIIVGNFLFILMLQITFLVGCHRMIKFSLPHTNPFNRLQKVFQLGRWILYEFEPYSQTRDLIKTQFVTRKIFAKSLFQFMHKG